MFITQVSVFVENTAGRLNKITGILADSGIDIRALSIADTTDFGILRLIVNNPDKAIEVLKASDITAKKTPVIAARLEDTPGSLHRILSLLKDVEYIYAFLSHNEHHAFMVIRCEDADGAVETLKNNDVKLLADADILK